MEISEYKRWAAETGELGENFTSDLLSERTYDLQKNTMLLSLLGISLSLGVVTLSSLELSGITLDKFDIRMFFIVLLIIMCYYFLRFIFWSIIDWKRAKYSRSKNLENLQKKRELNIKLLNELKELEVQFFNNYEEQNEFINKNGLEADYSAYMNRASEIKEQITLRSEFIKVMGNVLTGIKNASKAVYYFTIIVEIIIPLIVSILGIVLVLISSNKISILP